MVVIFQSLRFAKRKAKTQTIQPTSTTQCTQLQEFKGYSIAEFHYKKFIEMIIENTKIELLQISMQTIIVLTRKLLLRC